MRRLALLVAVAATAGCATTSESAPPPPDIYAYSLVAPLSVSSSGLVARAVIPGAKKCPALDVGSGTPVPMTARQPARTTGDAFSATLVCSAPIPASATQASIDGVEVPSSMPREVTTIAAIADTGCMIQQVVQDCNSGERWPFAANAKQVTADQPDLLIHVGDYFYRERACPAGFDDRCGGSPAPPAGMPFLDSAEGWLVDFFAPGRPMLNAAPLLAVRGNHEECEVAGNGYFLYLDPRPGSENTCAPSKGQVPSALTEPWRVDVPAINGATLRLIVVDSSYGWDYGISPWHERLRPGYRKAARWARDAGVQPWLITHEPSLGITTTKYDPGNVKGWTPWVTVDQTAASHGLLGDYAAIVSGHVHLSQVVKVPGLPPQFIAGAGGTELDSAEGIATPKVGPLRRKGGAPMLPGVKPYPPASYRWTAVEHSYAVASPNPSAGAWEVQYRKPDGSTLATCSVRGGEPRCS